MKACFLAISTNIEKKRFAIVDFVEKDELAVEIVPCCWILPESLSQQFICRWPGYATASKYTISQKLPNDNWDSYVCIPRKFFGKFKKIF